MSQRFNVQSVDLLVFEILLRKGLVDARKVTLTRELMTREHIGVERALIDSGFVTDREIAAAYAEDSLLPLFEGADEALGDDDSLGRILPEKLCRDKLLVPLALRGDTLEVGFASPESIILVDELQLLTGLSIYPMIAPLSVIDARIDLYYEATRNKHHIAEGAAFQQEDDPEPEEENVDECMLQLDQAPPPGESGRIIRMVNHILEQAMRTGASDIHLEPFEDGPKFRLRIDGVLHELPAPSRSVFVMIISRFKILAKLDIAEKRVPQDGAIAVKTTDKRIDLRVSTVPTIHGEKLVMRILDKASISFDLTGLGLDARQAADLIEAVRMPHGLALVTGPTGSGKSTTLYSCLNLLNEPRTNICTVEDPVEYKFTGLNQVQVKTAVGLTFASALRAFLRQDPDVIMVGEVRDQETAEICLRAALTGHFVLSTIHTNDALSAVTRLKDMGIEPFLLSCSVRVLEAQRLVRKLCPYCKESYECEPETARRFGLEAGEILYRPKGCGQCRQSGYRGRIGVFEVIRITPKLARLIQVGTPLPDLRAAAREDGMKMLFESALEKVRLGITSLEAALSVSMDED